MDLNGLHVGALYRANLQVWQDTGAGPKLVFERNLQAGPLFACQPCNDEPRILGFSGPCCWPASFASSSSGFRAFHLL